MKFLLTILPSLIYLTAKKSAANERDELNKDLLEFQKFYPEEEMNELLSQSKDEINDMLEYLKSPCFLAKLNDVEKTEEFQEIFKYLNESNFDAYERYNEMKQLLLKIKTADKISLPFSN